MKLKVYVNRFKKENGDEYTRYSVRIKETNEYADVFFAKKNNIEAPEVNSLIELDNKDIFETTEEGAHRKSYVIMNYISMKPLERKIIEDDFFA